MRIKVTTRHWIYTKAPVGFTPAQITYDYEESFIFKFEDNTLRIGNWSRNVDTLEDCFKAIKGYFYDSHYHIVDFIPLQES